MTVSDGTAMATRIVQNPPKTLSELQRLVGPFSVDFAKGEAMGFFSRPSMRALAPDAPPAPPVAPGLRSFSVRHGWDMHHEDPYRPRELYFSSVSYSLTLSREELLSLLTTMLGAPRVFTHPERKETWSEFGAFYVGPFGTLEWHSTRPEWAHPRIEASTRAAMLSSFVAALKSESAEATVLQRMQLLFAACGVEAKTPGVYGSKGEYGFTLTFKPGLSVQEVTTAFGWSTPVAQSTDVHMSSWCVHPAQARHQQDPVAAIGSWIVEVQLDGWPRGANGAQLPELSRPGPTLRYDVSSCVTLVPWMLVIPVRYA